MFTSKQALLDDLATRVIRTINVAEQADATAKKAGVQPYIANVLDMESGKVTKRNVLFYVVDEGTDEERAYYENGAGSRVSLEAEAVAYLSTLPYTRVQVQEVDASNEFIIVRAFKPNADETVSEVRVMVYKDGDKPTHKEIT